MTTYADIYLETRKRLKAAGVEASALEARLIVAGAAGKTQTELLSDLKLYVSEPFEEKVSALVDRRLGGEPVAYITGEWEFYGIPILVTKDVLIPRMDTELLAEKAIDLLRSHDGQTRVLDLCSGSGCIGIAIATNVPDSRVIMIDQSERALSVARTNILKRNLSRSITCIQGDALRDPPMMIGKLDLIVCNPPYIPTAEIKTLDASVAEYEPIAALDGGPDGMRFYREIIPRWRILLREHGVFLFECGEGQAPEIAELLHENGFETTVFFQDSAGVDRVVAGALK